jgi:hypothetical protein
MFFFSSDYLHTGLFSDKKFSCFLQSVAPKKRQGSNHQIQGLQLIFPTTTLHNDEPQFCYSLLLEL